MENRAFGVQLDLSGSTGLACDPDTLDGNRPQKWCGDFAEFNFEWLAMSLPAQPETEPIRDHEGSEDDRAQRYDQISERDQQQTIFRHPRPLLTRQMDYSQS